MSQKSPLVLLLLILSLAVLSPAAGQAQNDLFTVALMGGLGGATDSDSDSSISNFGFEALFSYALDTTTRFAIRFGQMDLEADSNLGSAFDSELTYLTLAGEYQFSGGFYDSSLFLGLGAYDVDPYLDPETFALVSESEALGLTIGTTGDFRVSDRLSVLVEFSGHYADLEFARFFVMGHVGLAVHF